MGAVLVTGATGFIGSNVCAALAAVGHHVVGLDNFSNSSRSMVERLRAVAGPIEIIEADVRDEVGLSKVFGEREISSVIHLAGVKSVEESMSDPLRYININVMGSATLLRSMTSAGVRSLVFSSSCTVYGDGGSTIAPLDETAKVAPTSPYGRSKAMVEQMLSDLAASDPSWRLLSLRYFNPAGADPSLRLGDAPTSTSRNLVPLAVEAAAGERSHIDVFGMDYPTPDGTCVRDYLHVSDLASAHLAALACLDHTSGHSAVNLGREEGSSVLDVVEAVERVSGRSIERRICDRRPGDAVALFADATKARKMLGWQAQRSLDDLCRDHWAWHKERSAVRRR